LGSKPVPGYTIACPKELPFGSVLLIEGVGVRWCEDRGSGITGQHVDVLLSDHETAKRFTRQAKVTLLHLGEPRGTR
jgi:3D (Asp-Asp-Asp) domain-containing protein